MTPDLTLSYGLRWDYQPPYREVDDQISTFLPTSPNPGAARTCPARWRSRRTDVDRYGHSFQDTWYGGYRPAARPRLLADAEDDPARVLGDLLQRDRQPELGDAGRLPGSPSFSSPNNYHAGVQLERAAVPADRSTVRRPLDPSFANGQSVTYTTRDAARLPRVQSFNVGVARELGDGPDAGSELHRQPIVAPGAAGQQLGTELRADRVPGARQPAVPADHLAAAAANAGFVEPFPGFANQLGANTVAQSLKPYPQYTSITRQLDPPDGRRGALRLGAGQGDQRVSQGLSIVSFYTYMRNRSNTNYTLAYPGERPLGDGSRDGAAHLLVQLVVRAAVRSRRVVPGGDSGFVAALVSGWNVRRGAALPVGQLPSRSPATQQPVAARLQHQVRRPRRRRRTSTRIRRATSIPRPTAT